MSSRISVETPQHAAALAAAPAVGDQERVCVHWRGGGAWTCAGAPVPYFGDLADEARDWAAWASLPERRVYLAAILNTLPRDERAALLDAVRGMDQ